MCRYKYTANEKFSALLGRFHAHRKNTKPKKYQKGNLRMMYLIAIFFPPLYFMMKKKWLAFGVTAFLAILSFFFFMMVVFAPVAFILWALSSICAVWDLRKQVMHEHANSFAQKMADAMRQQQSPPPASAPRPPLAGV